MFAEPLPLQQRRVHPVGAAMRLEAPLHRRQRRERRGVSQEAAVQSQFVQVRTDQEMRAQRLGVRRGAGLR